MAYSGEFKRIIKNREIVGLLIRGSHVAGMRGRYEVLPKYSDWEEGRRIIARAINNDGSILDIGCANGFLLRCLQEWSGRKLVPYGIDIDYEGINAAQHLFRGQSKNFIGASFDKIGLIAGLPKKFNFIYWTICDNWDLKKKRQLALVNETYKHVKPGGRLVLGFYKSRKYNDLRISGLRKVGFKLSAPVYASHGHVAVVWADK